MMYHVGCVSDLRINTVMYAQGTCCITYFNDYSNTGLCHIWNISLLIFQSKVVLLVISRTVCVQNNRMKSPKTPKIILSPPSSIRNLKNLYNILLLKSLQL